MRIKHLIIGIFSVTIGLSGLVMLFSDADMQQYQPRKNSSRLKTGGIHGAIEWLNMRRANPATGKVDISDVFAAEEQVNHLNKMNKDAASALNWIEMGPENVGGRTRAILVDRNNPTTIFAGGVSGGLWKSTNEGISWYPVTCYADTNSTGGSGEVVVNMIVTSLCQAPNGDIYFGTGESFMGSSGAFHGQGIFKSNNGGASFFRLTSTWDNSDAKTTFYYVNEIAADPNNSSRIFAATVKGLRVTTNGGVSWENPVPSEGGRTAEDVKVGKNSCVIVSYVGPFHFICRSDNGNTGTFVKDTISLSARRQELAIAPEDENYMYCQIAKSDGSMLGVYKSTDKGVNWVLLGTPGTDFNILGNQGEYDNVIAVYPNNKNKILCGGQFSLWMYDSGWKAVSFWSLPDYFSLFVHADHHAITFHPSNPEILYIGTDGGIFRSATGGDSYLGMNKKYNVTQFYTVGFSGDGRVIGGTQDNGTQYCNPVGYQPKNFTEVKGGDGGYCEISTLRPEVYFGTTYYGQLGRSEKPGEFIVDEFFDTKFLAEHTSVGSPSEAAFVTPILLWESYNDSLSADSVVFRADRNYTAGEVVHARSKMNNRDLVCTLPRPLLKDCTILVQDKFQAVLAIGMNGLVWITRKPLNFSYSQAPWFPINPKSMNVGMIYAMAFSKDGNYIFYTDGYFLYRSSNLNYSRTPEQMDATKATCNIKSEAVSSFNGVITSISVDPNNPGNVIVTIGGYNDSGGKVYYSTNATATASSVTFTAKDNFLFPVYASLILQSDYKKVMIGTEYGIYVSDDITANPVTWTTQSSLGNVPIFMIRQQTIKNSWLTGVTNNGFIYVATHGRGIWRCEDFKGTADGIEDNAATSKSLQNISVYPNPAHGSTNVSLKLEKSSDIMLNIYDLQGKLVKTLNLKDQGAGNHNYPINISDLGQGNYFLNAVTGEGKSVLKFIVY